MDRIALAPRPDWEAKAEEAGFRFAFMHGEPYWDETSAYSFTLAEIEDGIEDPCTELHAMCREAAAQIAGSQELMERLAIPPEHRDFVAASWRDEHPEIYGRFDLIWGGAGTGDAKMIEYNADTPTSLFETASFQWTWLEDQLEAGVLADGCDQFNRLHEALVERWGQIFRPGDDVHFTAFEELIEDYSTVEAMAWAAREAGLGAHFVDLPKIGLTEGGQFADAEGQVIGALFKLYPWEDLLRDDFAAAIAGSACLFLEPPWKALVSNKGILPVLWRMFEGHPNLLPAFFEDEVEAGAPAVSRAAEALGRGHVRKPVFSREGANVTITEGGTVTEQAGDRSYDAHPAIVQAYQPMPVLDGQRPVLGAWIVGETCVALGMREDPGRITQDLSRFKPHFIRP